MQQMTAEDLTVLNNLLEKYDIKGWSPAFISTQSHPCAMTLLPFELVGDEVVTLIKDAPDKRLNFPIYDGVKWTEGGEKTQAQILTEIREEQEAINKKIENAENRDANADGDAESLRKDVKNLSRSITMLTALVTKQAGAGVTPTAPVKKDGEA